jgi:hypothetical protein
MEVSEQSKDDQFEGDEDYSESGGSDPDSDEDPSYSILEETHAKFSNLSIKKKKSKARLVSHPWHLFIYLLISCMLMGF